MATGKRFYWMKLKESFMTSDTIDYFMSQPNGAQYVVLYQMLCLKTINTNGKLERQIGEVIIPYDIGKIKRDTKWFSEDTIRVALNLFKSFGLIYEDQNGALVMADHENLVGSETDYAAQKSSQRLKIKEKKNECLLPGVDNVHNDVHKNVHTEIRDRYIDKDKEEEDKEEEENSSSSFSSFTKEETLIQIQQDHNEILNAAENAGFPQNQATFAKIIDLYAEYGKETVLTGISACVEQGKTVLSYLRKCCQNIYEEKSNTETGKKTLDRGLEDWDEHKRGTTLLLQRSGDECTRIRITGCESGETGQRDATV